MKNNDRLQALFLLTSLLDKKASLSQTLSASELSPMTKELCFGFCRHYYRLEAIAKALLGKKPKETQVWIAILLGIYQLEYLKQPDYAVVQETVALLSAVKKNWAKALVNAVLRNFCRQRETILTELAGDAAYQYGQSPWFLKAIQDAWPKDWEAIASANDRHPPMVLRVNQQQLTTEAYLKRLEEAGIEAKAHTAAPEGIILTTACKVQELPGFAQGMVSVQDGAAQLAVSLLDLQPGQRVLDACAAPGGKTCHIVESEPDLSLCLALDLDSARLQRVADNLQRLHLQADLLQGDAAKPETWWDGKLFDRILLDAPCSATGVIRRHSDIKLLRSQDEVDTVVSLQKTMLQALWPLLAPGGLLVYATCSIFPAENSEQIASFVKNTKNVTVLDKQQLWGRDIGFGRQILPGEQEMDGFFYSVLLKDKT